MEFFQKICKWLQVIEFSLLGFLCLNVHLVPRMEEMRRRCQTGVLESHYQEVHCHSFYQNIGKEEAHLLLAHHNEQKAFFAYANAPIYLINPTSACQNGADLLIYVHSAISNVEARAAVRETYGDGQNYIPLRIITLFMLGKPGNSEFFLQKQVEMEAERYGDIVQEGYMDTYRNLTYKAAAAARWALAYCQQARYILKADDDVFVDLFKLLFLLDLPRKTPIFPPERPIFPLERSIFAILAPKGPFSANKSRFSGETAENTLLCRPHPSRRVLRDTNAPYGRWATNCAQFRADFYPFFCHAAYIIMAPSGLKRLYSGLLNSQFLWLEDVWFTGLLRNSSGIRITKDAVWTKKAFVERLELQKERLLDRLDPLTFSTSRNYTLWRLLWADILYVVFVKYQSL